ncbi:MAG: hypothetical protein ACMUJM_23835 [bacterium]
MEYNSKNIFADQLTRRYGSSAGIISNDSTLRLASRISSINSDRLTLLAYLQKRWDSKGIGPFQSMRPNLIYFWPIIHRYPLHSLLPNDVGVSLNKKGHTSLGTKIERLSLIMANVQGQASPYQSLGLQYAYPEMPITSRTGKMTSGIINLYIHAPGSYILSQIQRRSSTPQGWLNLKDTSSSSLDHGFSKSELTHRALIHHSPMMSNLQMHSFSEFNRGMPGRESLIQPLHILHTQVDKGIQGNSISRYPAPVLPQTHMQMLPVAGTGSIAVGIARRHLLSPINHAPHRFIASQGWLNLKDTSSSFLDHGFPKSELTHRTSINNSAMLSHVQMQRSGGFNRACDNLVHYAPLNKQQITDAAGLTVHLARQHLYSPLTDSVRGNSDTERLLHVKHPSVNKEQMGYKPRGAPNIHKSSQLENLSKVIIVNAHSKPNDSIKRFKKTSFSLYSKEGNYTVPADDKYSSAMIHRHLYTPFNNTIQSRIASQDQVLFRDNMQGIEHSKSPFSLYGKRGIKRVKTPLIYNVLPNKAQLHRYAGRLFQLSNGSMVENPDRISAQGISYHSLISPSSINNLPHLDISLLKSEEKKPQLQTSQINSNNFKRSFTSTSTDIQLFNQFGQNTAFPSVFNALRDISGPAQVQTIAPSPEDETESQIKMEEIVEKVIRKVVRSITIERERKGIFI